MTSADDDYGRAHLGDLAVALGALGSQLDELEAWGRALYATLSTGGRLLAAGNGGSAAQAQHLTSELVGRFRHDRPAFSALSLHAESSSVTAIGNDYGYGEVFARQVEAHARSGDVVVALSTSGRSPNLLALAEPARRVGAEVWALTGPAPNPLAGVAKRAVCVEEDDTALVQEVHLVALHLLCHYFDEAAGTGDP